MSAASGPAKKRSMVVRYDEMTARKGWSNAAMVVSQYDNAEVTRQVTIPIRGPSDLCDFRRRLDEIEADWHRQLGIES